MFQKTVMIIAVILLILTLTIIGYMLWKDSHLLKYPPEVSLCPDFWKVVGEPVDPNNPAKISDTPIMKCHPQNYLDKPLNVGSWGNRVMDFGSAQFQGKDSNMAKCKWANDNGIFWDGITDSGPCIKMKS